MSECCFSCADVCVRVCVTGECSGRSKTALMLAASNGHEAAMKVLLQEGADLTVQDQVSE